VNPAKPRGGARRSGSRRGHSSEPGAWYAGVSPPRCFVPRTGGVTWEASRDSTPTPLRIVWIGGEQSRGRPAGATVHSINVDPRDPRHLYLGISIGGAFESSDRGETGGRSTGASRPTSFPSRARSTATTCTALRLHPLAPDRSVPAESLRDLPARPSRVNAGSASATPCRRRSAISASRSCCIRATPTRCGCSRWTGAPCGPRLPGRQARGLRFARRRPDLAPPGQGPPAKQGWFTVKRQAMWRRRARSGGRVLRHDERRGLDERVRGRPLDLDRAPPSEIYSVEAAGR